LLFFTGAFGVNILKLAGRLPGPIKLPLRYVYGSIPPSVLYGKSFKDTYSFLQISQWWSRQKLEEYQMERLGKLLNHAYLNVPYYQKAFDESNVKPRDIQSFSDLRKLPYLTKDIIQRNLKDLVARNYPKSKLHYITTGGSTGIPTGFFWERGVTDPKEAAFVLSQWNRVGYKWGARCVMIRGAVLPSTSKGRYWEYDPGNKQLVFSSNHMANQNLPFYIEQIKKYKPEYFFVFPSSITMLAQFMKENKIAPFPGVKAILCSSESLYPWQRTLIGEVFQTRIFDLYGHTERAVLASECEVSSKYHVSPEYGLMELIDNNGVQINDSNMMGEIVATGFNNFAMPFIRYRTMDLAVPFNEQCRCGRNYRLLEKIEGRIQDFIITKTKRPISIASTNMHSGVFDNVYQYQFFQDTAGKLLVNIVKKPVYTEQDTDHIRKALLQIFNNDIDLTIGFVENIPRTSGGKYRLLVQKLKIDFAIEKNAQESERNA
jgi:phenylacetate-CoA ligase